MMLALLGLLSTPALAEGTDELGTTQQMIGEDNPWNFAFTRLRVDILDTSETFTWSGPRRPSQRERT